VLAESAALGVEPLLGCASAWLIRAASAELGGEKAKFGSPRHRFWCWSSAFARGRLHCLRLLHSHIGSQIPNLRDIRHGMGRSRASSRSCAAWRRDRRRGRWRRARHRLRGHRQPHYCSINYTLDGYAREIVKPLARVCAEHDLPPPAIYTESGAR